MRAILKEFDGIEQNLTAFKLVYAVLTNGIALSLDNESISVPVHSMEYIFVINDFYTNQIVIPKDIFLYEMYTVKCLLG